MTNVCSRSSWTVAVFLLGAGGPAGADLLAIDFDTDGDPTTIENVIEAEVGDLVRGYLVLDYIPGDYDVLLGVQFGLDHTAGLEPAGLQGGQSGALIHDGLAGIAAAFATPIHREDLPAFIVSVIFEVTDAGVQEVSVTPSMGWGHIFDGFQFAVAHEGGPLGGDLVESARPIDAQLRGYVNRGETPVATLTWGAVKKLYSDDAL
jgi:hypothetical protein